LYGVTGWAVQLPAAVPLTTVSESQGNVVAMARGDKLGRARHISFALVY
jgi:hypothetical protein